MNIGTISSALAETLFENPKISEHKLFRKYKINNCILSKKTYEVLKQGYITHSYNGRKTPNAIHHFTGKLIEDEMDVKNNVITENERSFFIRTWTNACVNFLEFKDEQIEYLYARHIWNDDYTPTEKDLIDVATLPLRLIFDHNIFDWDQEDCEYILELVSEEIIEYTVEKQ